MQSNRFSHEDLSAQTQWTGHRRPQDALREIPGLISELREYMSFYVAMKKDAAGAQAREVLAKAVLGVVGLLFAASLIGTSAWLILSGLAVGLGKLFGRAAWLAGPVLGIVVLLAVAATIWFGIKSWKRASLQATVSRYEAMKERQTQRFRRWEESIRGDSKREAESSA